MSAVCYNCDSSEAVSAVMLPIVGGRDQLFWLCAECAQANNPYLYTTEESADEAAAASAAASAAATAAEAASWAAAVAAAAVPVKIRTFCRYGRTCYQKNPEHIKRFTHPS